MISEKTFKEIEAIIEKFSLAISIVYAGTDDVPDRDVALLLKEGILTEKDLQLSAVDTNFAIGKARALMPGQELEKISVPDFKKKYAYLIQNATDEEKGKIKLLRKQAQTALVGARDALISSMKGSLLNMAFEHTARVAGSEPGQKIKESYLSGEGMSKLISELKRNAKDYSQKWSRIAITETTKAINSAAADAILDANKDKSPSDIKVFFQTVGDGRRCKYCTELYLNPDGTPKVFSLAEILANGSNYGRKAAEYKPSITGVHFRCRCQIANLPEGWSFASGTSRLVYVGKKK